MALNLIIPPGLGVGQQWFPHRYEPSIVLTKTIPVEPTKLPEPAPILDEAQAVDAPAVVLTSYIGHDTVFACYHATFERTRGVADEAGDDEPVLVAKLVDLSHFPKVDATHVAGIIARDFESWTSLKDVQGGPVPRFAGLFTHGTLCRQVFEDAGRAISYEEKQQKSVRYVYATRLAHPVGHTDDQSRDFRDFQGAVSSRCYPAECCLEDHQKRKRWSHQDYGPWE
jgi:hypothetical protein